MLNITSHQENADQKHIELSHLWEWLSSKRENKCWWECGDKEYGTPLMRIWTCIAIRRDSLENPQEIKIRTTIGLSNPTFGVYIWRKWKSLPWRDFWIPTKKSNSKSISTPTFIAASFTLVKTWKPPKFPLTDEWIREIYEWVKEIYKIYCGILFSHKKGNSAICNNKQSLRAQAHRAPKIAQIGRIWAELFCLETLGFFPDIMWGKL